MRKIIMTLVIALFAVHCFAQKVRLGITASPMLSWTKPDKSFSKGKMRGGLEYGLVTDIALNDDGNYNISTGLILSVTGGNIEGPSGLNMNARFKLQYITLPILLKLKTDRFKDNFAFYGTFGVLNGFRYSAKADVELNGQEIFSNESITKKNNPAIFKSTLYNFSLQAGAGIEYYVSDKTSIVGGLFYNHGFIPVIKYEPGGTSLNLKATLSNLGLRLGVMF
jgi:hypothetical protein